MTITRTIEVAGGVFAPGHVGELTRIVPFELVDAVLEEAGGAQRRLRDLPSRVGVYFLLAMCLFPEVGYGLVWGKLTAGIGDGLCRAPTAKALRDLRRRIGVPAVKALFQVLAGPLATPGMPGARYGRYRVVSFDGCTSQKVRDTARNRAWLGRRPGAGYPILELMTLVETGTRAVIGAVFGPSAEGETGYAGRLLHLLARDMLVLWDKGFDGNAFLAAVNDTGAKFLGRVSNNRRPPVLARLDDGSYLSLIGGLPVRIVAADITVTCQDGTEFTGAYRLATNLFNPRRHPAAALIGLYHQRWEHESAYYALRHTMLAGRVLRSGDRSGVEQEMWALLTTYQVLRTAMVDAVATVPGTDPDRAGFTIAMQCARDRLITAAGVVTDHPDLIGQIGKQILAGLLPPRRLRVSTRKVKSPISRYSARNTDGRPLTSQNITALSICVHTPPDGDPPARLPGLPPAERPAHAPPTRTRLGRLNTIVELMRTNPDQPWTATDIAYRLGLDPHDTRTQLRRWAHKGLFLKTARATYALP